MSGNPSQEIILSISTLPGSPSLTSCSCRADDGVPVLTRFQVSDEKSCMQFSIRRPTLPSSETHPEERLYRRLDVATWLRHLNHSGQVEEEYKLRKVGWQQGTTRGRMSVLHKPLALNSPDVSENVRPSDAF